MGPIRTSSANKNVVITFRSHKEPVGQVVGGFNAFTGRCGSPKMKKYEKNRFSYNRPSKKKTIFFLVNESELFVEKSLKKIIFGVITHHVKLAFPHV